MNDKPIFSEDTLFDCTNPEDNKYVASLYGNRKTVVASFLRDKCRSSAIFNLTHLDIYELIELKLGYPIPSNRN